MKRLVFAVALLALLSVAPAFALVTSAPVSAAGITPEEMAKLMTDYGWPPKLAKGNNGDPVISSRIADVTFDVYFYECHSGRCTDIQLTAGWSNAKVTPDKVNQWNATNRFLRSYWRPGNVLWAEMDARIARGTTANVEEYLALWRTTLRQFKIDMGL